MKANQATYPVRVMGRLLGVSASGFYAWAGRPPSARAVEDIGLTALIHAIHRRSDGAYGAPSIHAELADDHHRRVGKKRVARLMRAARLQGLRPRRFVTTTIGDPTADRALDQVDREFTAAGPAPGLRAGSEPGVQDRRQRGPVGLQGHVPMERRITKNTMAPTIGTSKIRSRHPLRSVS